MRHALRPGPPTVSAQKYENAHARAAVIGIAGEHDSKIANPIPDRSRRAADNAPIPQNPFRHLEVQKLKVGQGRFAPVATNR